MFCSSFRPLSVAFVNSSLRSISFTSKGTIATWSSLAAAFNSKPVRKPNYSLLREDNGLFNIPELVDPSGFFILQERVKLRTDELVNESKNTRRERKMVAVFDELSDTLCRVADMAEFIRVAHPEADYSMAAESACTHINALVEKLNTNRRLYSALKQVIEDGDDFPLDELDKHVANLFLFDFEQSGIHLDDNKRERVVALNEEILKMGTHFVHNSHAVRRIPKNGILPELQHVFPLENDMYTVPGLHADSNNEKIREAAYKIYLYPDPHQEELLKNILRARQELAQLCGFPTYAHRTLNNSLAGNPDVVMQFLSQMSEIVRDPAMKNFSQMEAAKKKTFALSSKLSVWDVPFFSALIKNEKYNIYIPDFTPYFSLGACMDGLNCVFGSLFGIELKLQECNPGELWVPEVYKLAVIHSVEGLLGYIYCDFFERRGKPNQDCHFTIQGGRQLSDGSYQIPIVVLLLNFPEPTSKSPSLLTPSMMENLFHEMGHAMHSMLARTKYQHVTGTRCSTDFAEVPSILMEFFVNDPRVLSKFCRHFKTGEPMPDDMIRRLCNSKNEFIASEMQLQIFYSAVDQVYHTQPINNQSTTDIMARVQERFYGLPHITNTAWQLRFSHLIGYGAKYYSYIMARAVASLIWQECFKQNPFNPTMGEKYRRKLLAHGGGRSPNELIEALLGKAVTPQLLCEALQLEIFNASLPDRN